MSPGGCVISFLGSFFAGGIDMVSMRKWLKSNLPKPVRMFYYYIRVVRLLVVTFVPKYNHDELITSHSSDFKDDDDFYKAYSNAVKLGLHVKEDIYWRAHVCCWAGSIANNLDGDFVECGVNKGFLSKIVIDYLSLCGENNKKFYLFDTYEGLSNDLLTQSEVLSGKTGVCYEYCYDIVLDVFSECVNVVVVKGVVPYTLYESEIKKVAYLSIDMNCVVPEIEAINYFWPMIVVGGIVILDDYGHSGHEEQKKDFDLFALDKGVKILYLPTGQGVIIKN